MKALKLPSIFFVLFLYSCNKHDGKISLSGNEYFIENVSGDKILTYTVEKTQSGDTSERKTLFYIRLNPGEYKSIGKKNEVLLIPPTNIYQRDTLNGVFAWPKLTKKTIVTRDFEIVRTNILKPNTYPAIHEIEYDLAKRGSRVFLAFTDSVNTMDTIFYKYRYMIDTKSGTKKNPNIEYKNTFEIKGAVLYNTGITTMH